MVRGARAELGPGGNERGKPRSTAVMRPAGARRGMPWSCKRLRSKHRSGSIGQRVQHDVHRELRVVLGEEALVAPVVVPFAAVVLVAVEEPEAAVDLDALEVVVHEVVAPAVQLERGRRRTVELEIAAEYGMGLRQLL